MLKTTVFSQRRGYAAARGAEKDHSRGAARLCCPQRQRVEVELVRTTHSVVLLAPVRIWITILYQDRLGTNECIMKQWVQQLRSAGVQ
jgi:hypothetical protein